MKAARGRDARVGDIDPGQRIGRIVVSDDAAEAIERDPGRAGRLRRNVDPRGAFFPLVALRGVEVVEGACFIVEKIDGPASVGLRRVDHELRRLVVLDRDGLRESDAGQRVLGGVAWRSGPPCAAMGDDQAGGRRAHANASMAPSAADANMCS